MYREKGNHIITAVTEHKAIIDTCKRLEKDGYRVTYLAVQKDGPDQPRRAESGDHGQDDPDHDHGGQQRESAFIQPIAEIGANLLKRKGSSSTPTRSRWSANCPSTSTT